MYRKTNSLLSKFNNGSLLLFVVILIAFPKQVGISQSEEEINSVASSFYIVDDEADFPPVNPLGIKQDAAGNVHLWYFFIEPGSFDGDQDISVYYNILFTNGTNFLTQLLRESLLLTKFSFFQRLDFVETSDGKVYSIFVHTTLFGESIKRFGWSPKVGFFTEKLDFPSFLSLKGDIRGPIQNRDITEFYVTSSNSNGNKRLIQLRFSDGDYLGTNIIVFPTIINPELETSISMFDIFDIAYVNGSRFLLGSVPRSPDRMDLVIVEDHLNGNQTVFVQLDSINVSPIFPGLQFIAGILVDLLLPSLVSTENGRLYTFLFSFSETVQLNQLVRWTPNGKINVFQEFVENPFLISFFPVIEAVGNEVRIAALGFQIAQETFIVSVDTFRYNSETGEFSKKKISDNNFSFGIFLFAVDLESDDNLGFAGTVATPDYVKDEYNIVNDTVGSIFVFSEGVLPDILPNFLDVHVAEISLEDEEVINYRLIFIVSVISLLGLTVLFIWYRSKALKLPSIIKKARPEEEHHKKTVLERISSMVTSHLIYGKANRQRFQISIFVLIIPTLILMTVFTGIISHQAHLLQSYENQNPLNEDEKININGGDFTWTRTFINDEFSNNVLLAIDFEIPRQLSYTFLETAGTNKSIDNLSSTTIFQLFEERRITVLDEETGNFTEFRYPVYHDFAVIEKTAAWTEYYSHNLKEGRLPQNKGEVLAQESWFVERDPFNRDLPYGNIWVVDSTIEVGGSVLDLFFETDIMGLYQNVTVVGIVKRVENQPFQEIIDWAAKLKVPVTALRVLDQFPFYTYAENAADFINDFSRVAIQPKSLIDIRHNVLSFERNEIPDLVESYKKLQGKTLQTTGFPWLGNFSDNGIVEFLEGYFDASRSVLVEGSVILIPMLGITILLTYEALGIGKSSIEEELRRFRREGLRLETYISLFVFERVITSGVAMLISIWFVPVTTKALLELTGFFQEGSGVVPPVNLDYLVPIAFSVFFIMTLVGIVLSLRYLFNLQDWGYQHYLRGIKNDLLIVSGAILIVYVSSTIANLFQDQLVLNPAENTLDGSSELLVVSMRVIALLVMAFAGVLIISKTVNRFFMIVGTIIWKRSKTSKGLIFNGISSSMGLYGKTLLVFILSMFLMVPMIVVPATLEDKYQADAYYEFGSDIIVRNWDSLNPTTQNEILGINEIISYSEYFYGLIQFRDGIAVQTLAIDPSSFADTIVLPARHANRTGFDMSELQNLKQGQVYLDELFMSRNLFDIGEKINIGYEHQTNRTSLEIAGSYQEFPILRYEAITADNDNNIFQMVTSLETLGIFQIEFFSNATVSSNAIGDALVDRHMAIRIDHLDNVLSVTDNIKAKTGLKVEFIDKFVENRRHSFFRSFEFISHLSIIVGLFAPLLVTVISANVLFERRKFELEVYRRNGVSQRFYLFQLTFELILATLLPSLIGIPLGYWWSYNFGAELFGETQGSLQWQNKGVLIGIMATGIIIASLFLWIFRLLLQSQKHLEEVRL